MSAPEPKTDGDRVLLAELQAHADLRSTPPPNYLFASIEEFLLRHGTFFTVAPLPAPLKPMRIGGCFENAYRLATRTQAYHYVEGIAYSVIPVLHAWVIDANGTVIDPTWAHDMLGESYCGVELSLDHVRESRRKGSLTVLGDVPRRHPALAGVPVLAKNAWFRR